MILPHLLVAAFVALSATTTTISATPLPADPFIRELSPFELPSALVDSRDHPFQDDQRIPETGTKRARSVSPGPGLTPSMLLFSSGASPSPKKKAKKTFRH